MRANPCHRQTRSERAQHWEPEHPAPHLGDDSESPLKEEEFKRDLYMYARANLPEKHKLALAGWKQLPRSRTRLAQTIGFD